MSETPVNKDGENGMFMLDRREFMVGGLVLAAKLHLKRKSKRQSAWNPEY